MQLLRSSGAGEIEKGDFLEIHNAYAGGGGGGGV